MVVVARCVFYSVPHGFLMLFSVLLCFGVRGHLSVVKEGDGGGEGDEEDV